jgi:hypothetical protein
LGPEGAPIVRVVFLLATGPATWAGLEEQATRVDAIAVSTTAMEAFLAKSIALLLDQYVIASGRHSLPLGVADTALTHSPGGDKLG